MPIKDDFYNDLNELSKKVTERKLYVINEETTKQSLIIPFIQLLGFDIFNPQEVMPEYVSDFAKKKGEKVDYAIFNDGNAIFFIEAKAINENLEKHSAQLARYFNATHDLKLAILTNGIEYQFFTDLNVVNVIDENPFLRFNITAPNDEAIKFLKHISKDNFNSKSVQEIAQELVYAKDLDLAITKILKNPSYEFIRFILKDISDIRITSAVIDKFRPLVEKSIKNAIFNIVDALQEHNEECEKPNEAKSRKSNKKQPDNISEKTSDIVFLSNQNSVSLGFEEIASTIEISDTMISVPNEKEIEMFNALSKILEVEGFDKNNLKYSCNKESMSVHFGDGDKLFARIKHNGEKGYVIIPLEMNTVAKALGNLFELEECDLYTKICVLENKDIYKLSRLFVKFLNENN